MKAEELLKKFFDLNNYKSGFQSEKEFERCVFAFLDYCLTLLCNNNEHKTNSNLLEETVKILKDNFNDEISIKDNEIKEALSKLEDYIYTRYNNSSDEIKKGHLALLLCSFCVDNVDRIVLLLALSSFYDCKYEYIYSWLEDDVNVKLATVGIVYDVLALFGIKQNTELISDRLQKILIFDKKKGYSVFDETITINKRIVGFINGDNRLFDSKNDYLTYIENKKPEDLYVIRKSLYEKVKRTVNYFVSNNKDCATKNHNVVLLYGNTGMGKHMLLRHIAYDLGHPIICVDTRKIYGGKESEIESILNELVIERELTDAIVCFKDSKSLEEDDTEKEYSQGNMMFLTKRIIDKFDFSIWISKEVPQYLEKTSNGYIRFEFPRLMATERVELWKWFCEKYEIADNVDYITYANQYIHSPGQIKAVLETADSLRESEYGDCVEKKHILESIKIHTPAQLGKFASRINAVFKWDDLVLDESQKKQLSQICNQVRYRSIVGEEWGFFGKTPYGRGVCAMFYGPPGTGKTMAAQVMANELGIELYRIDLSQMVSKYIGETEKNISELFNKAKDINALLFFDEADSLFAKRSTVSDSNDRYANANTAHLLQKLEDYEGITILATNHYANIDDAFKRRIKFVINFSMPQVEERYKLWTSILPDTTPIEEDIDFDFFAQNFELTGSNIKEIISNAAYLAASEKMGLANKHIVKAVILNYGKYGKILTKSDFGYLGTD